MRGKDGKERNASGMTKDEFVKDAPDKKFSEWVWEQTKDIVPATQADMPLAWHDDIGDIIHVHVKVSDNGYYAKWINHTLTLLKTFDADEVCGFEIWGASKTSPRAVDWVLEFLSKNGVRVTAEIEDLVRNERGKL